MTGGSSPPSVRGQRQRRLQTADAELQWLGLSAVVGPRDLDVELHTKHATDTAKGSEDVCIEKQHETIAITITDKRKRTTSTNEDVDRNKTDDYNHLQKKLKTAIEVNLEGRREGNSSETLQLALRVPLEILWEIYKWSTPTDLLTLSRTNKSFKEYVLSDKSEVVEDL
ncbi:hypothetical protein H1R20_g5092, partial [Candolleomyces eurysporus]